MQPPVVCIFCASSDQVDPAIVRGCEEVATGLARRGYDLLYGGTTCGLMLRTAKAHQAAGGRVIGVITAALADHGITYSGLDERVVAADLRERKREMTVRSGAFIVFPGGIGTLDELFDVYGQKQLDEHDKPIVLLNLEGYYDHLLAFLRHAVAQHTIRPEHLGQLQVADTADAALRFFPQR